MEDIGPRFSLTNEAKELNCRKKEKTAREDEN